MDFGHGTTEGVLSVFSFAIVQGIFDAFDEGFDARVPLTVMLPTFFVLTDTFFC